MDNQEYPVCSYIFFFCCLDAPLLFFGLYLKGIWVFAFSALDRILPVVSLGCEIWSVTLKEEHRLLVLENRVQREILGFDVYWTVHHCDN